MERDMTAGRPADEKAIRRLAAEVQQVEAAVALVATGEAVRVTVGGLTFAEAIVDRLTPDARARGVELEAAFWPEDRGCDVIVHRPKGDADVEH
jgi:hypothetical protein